MLRFQLKSLCRQGAFNSGNSTDLRKFEFHMSIFWYCELKMNENNKRCYKNYYISLPRESSGWDKLVKKV